MPLLLTAQVVMRASRTIAWDISPPHENPFAANALDGLMVRTAPGRVRESHVRVPIDRYQVPLALAFAAFFFASFLNRGAE